MFNNIIEDTIKKRTLSIVSALNLFGRLKKGIDKNAALVPVDSSAFMGCFIIDGFES